MKRLGARVYFICSYLRYTYLAKGLHRIHSPFVFHFYKHILLGKVHIPVSSKIESIRKRMRIDNSVFSCEEYGAGSLYSRSSVRKVKNIAKRSLKSNKLAQLLYRLVYYQQPTYILDLGTSLGITTAYQASAVPNSFFYTFEGCSSILTYANQIFQELKLNHIKSVQGNLDHTLKSLITQIPQVDYVFFDANHQFYSTMSYFLICLEKAHEHTVFVFDDIHYSPEMSRAWRKIKEHDRVSITIDLFFIGIVFFKTTQVKQDFILRC